MLNLSVEIDAPPSDVWQVLADFGNIYQWNPGVKSSRLISSTTAGPGTARHCDLVPMGGLDEQVTTWQEDALMEIDVTGTGMSPIRSSTVRFALTPIDNGLRTRVGLSSDYVPAMGAFGRAMNAPVLSGQLTKGLRMILAGLKRRVETGDTSVPASELPLSAVSVA